MRTKLIEALRTTANKIETGAWHYRWDLMERCNCGLLAAAANEVEPDKLTICGIPFIWSDTIKVCLSTNQPLPLVIAKLIAIGASAEDVANLEYLSDNKIRERAQLSVLPPNWNDFEDDSQLDFYQKEAVVRYMRAWAALVEEEDTVASRSLVVT